MEYKIKESSRNGRELLISFKENEFTPKLNEELVKIKSETQLKGFRKGKAPLSLIKRYFEKDIQSKIVENLMQEHFQKICDDEKIILADQGKIKKFDVDSEKKTLDVVCDFEVIPKIQLKPLEEMTFEKTVYEVEDKDVERELESIAKHSGVWQVSKEEAKEDDMVVADVQAVDENDREIIGTRKENQEYVLSKRSLLPEVMESLVGSKVENNRFAIFKDGEQQKEKRLKFTIKEIKRLHLAEITDDFVKGYTQEKQKTVQEFKTHIKELLKKSYEYRSIEELKKEAKDRLIREYPDFEVPNAVLKTSQSIEYVNMESAYRNYGMSLKDNVNEKTEKAINKASEERSRWFVVCANLSKNMNITVSKDDMDRFFEEVSSRENLSIEEAQKRVLSSPVLLQAVNQSILSDKLLDKIISKVKTTESKKTVSAAIEEQETQNIK